LFCFDEDDDDDTILAEPNIPLKEYSFHVSFGLKKKQRVNPFLLFKNLALEMMQLDPSFKIYAYDSTQASDLWPLASPDNIPAEENLAQKYFVRSQINKQNTHVTVIFRVTSQYSHVEWRTKIASYLSNHRILLKQHKLEALETVCIGFIAKKHPHYTHLNRFEEYLRDTLPDHTPQFTIRHLKPRIPATFTEAIKTEVLGIETSTEHAPLLHDILQHAFLLNHKDNKFFVSYRANIDDARLQSLYRIQNNWLAQVKVVKIGGDRNIDKRFHVGLSQPVSLCDFIRTQPTDPNNFHYAMDADNGGKDGKPVIIVMPTPMMTSMP
jgi:hypothetical protein